MSSALTINPADLVPPPAAMVNSPGWASLYGFLKSAARMGEVVDLTSRAEALSPNQVASRLAMSRASVMKLISDGSLQAYRVGTHWRISMVEFQRFCDLMHAELIRDTSDELEAELYG